MAQMVKTKGKSDSGFIQEMSGWLLSNLASKQFSHLCLYDCVYGLCV